VRYPLAPDEIVYTPDVTVLRAGPVGHYRLVRPFRVAAIACPGPRHPTVEAPEILPPPGLSVDPTVHRGYGDRARMSRDVATALAEKIRLTLTIAAHHGHDTLVLGALGCGAFNCPSRHVAELFRAELARPEFRYGFRLVVFAVLAEGERGRANLRAFCEVLTPSTESQPILAQ
jgi:hypothetical protein